MMIGMATGGRDARGYVGLVYLALTIFGAGGAVFLAHYFHLGVAATAAAVLLAAPGLYLAWATFRADHSEAGSGEDLARIADDLSLAVRAQWQDEARLRRLNDPYALAVSWRSAPDDLVEAWPLLTSIARAWPEGPAGDSVGWTHGADGLSGDWSQILEVFTARVPTRRLVVLGEPGAGKTMLLVKLAEGLIDWRAGEAGRPVPVIFSLGSWNPFGQGLYEWMASCLVRDYPGLEQPVSAPGGRGSVTRGRALLDQRMILPVLDGLDELPALSRSAALDAINRSLTPGQGVVVSSRTCEYREAAASDGRISIKLAGAAGIELQPLDAAVIASYLVRDAGDDASALRRWEPVIQQLGADSPVGLTLRTPLMLFLARTIYNPRPGTDRDVVVPVPAVLCDPALFPDRAALECHLFDAFVPAAYRPLVPGAAPPFPVDQAKRALTFFARHLDHDLRGTPDLAWWRLPLTLPRSPTALFVWTIAAMTVLIPVSVVGACAGGVTYGLVSRMTGGSWADLAVGVVAMGSAGFVLAVVFAIGSAGVIATRVPLSGSSRIWSRESAPLNAVGWSIASRGVLLAAAVGLAVGTAVAAVVGVSVGIGVGFPIAIGGVILGGVRPAAADVTKAGDPASLLARDRRSFLRGIFTAVTAGMITAGAVSAAWNPLSQDFTGAVVRGAISGATVGLVVAIMYVAADMPYRSAWLPFTVTRWYLTLRCGLPRDLMGFLSDAHERGVLRQVAGLYQFRHVDLQRRLAGEPAHDARQIPPDTDNEGPQPGV
ncbi:NACHT domain-containing protein [Streptomyces sp. NRRL WC-3618]|uniref:NACHT domain-containing protein n=1 Tax=Streptomyces sp. NRRL WC-3618 TaxID=1519490 RepID=UPI000AF95F0F|nr:NACHT domain-containing protein [Streptomyces sp. NRRL WC-3618]